jgi:hypothetical protein
MLVNCEGIGISATGMMLVGMGRQRSARSHFDLVRSGIGSVYSHFILRCCAKPLPDRIAELLRQLDDSVA